MLKFFALRQSRNIDNVTGRIFVFVKQVVFRHDVDRRRIDGAQSLLSGIAFGGLAKG